MTQLSHYSRCATLGPLGMSPFAPGTVGTIAGGIPTAFLLSILPPWLSSFLLVSVFVFSCCVSEQAIRELGRDDPSQVVIDEAVGFLVTMIWLPFTAKSVLLGVAAFRLFDIWKPWPVNILDAKIKGGLGVVLDDVGAGVLAHVVVWGITAVWQ